MPDRSRRALAPHADDAAPLPAGIHRIALPTPFAVGRINTYLLEGDPLTLIDCGVNTGVSLDTLEACLAELGHRIEDLELVILTHEHFDHVGLAEIIARRAGCRVAGFAALQSLFDPDENAGEVIRARVSWSTAQLERGGYPSMLAIATESAMTLGVALGSRPPIDVPLSEGDVIRAGGRDLTVLHRPGHSLSDIVLVDRTDGTAFVGDHLLAGMSPNPILAPPHEVKFPDARTERVRSLLLYLDSVKKTAEDELTLVLPGHGPSIGPPRDLIADRLAFHEKRAAKIAAMLDDEPRTVYDLATRLWRDVPIRQPQLTHSEVLGHLDLLAERGEATDVPLEDGIVGFIAG